MINHLHAVRTPELVEVLLITVKGQRFQVRILTIIEIDSLYTIVRLVGPGHLAGITRVLVDRVAFDDETILTIKNFIAQESISIFLNLIERDF